MPNSTREHVTLDYLHGISGVDAHQLSDLFFTKLGGEKNCDAQNIPGNCKELGMDCSSLSSITATCVLETSLSTLPTARSGYSTGDAACPGS